MARKILIIEKNGKIRALLTRHLGEKGHEILEARHGLEAARLLRQVRPDLMLIDQGIDLGGIRTARILRLHPEYQQIPIVLILDQRQEVDELKAEGRALNLESFLLKPFTAAQLEAAIAESLRKQLSPLSLAQVRREIANLSQLPVLQPNHRKLLSLLGREDKQVDVPEVVRAVEADQGMATTVLRLCRSAYYGFRGNSIEGAVTFLGIDKLRQIVQAVIVFDAFAIQRGQQEVGGFSIMELWKHGLACGIIMEKGGRLVRGRDHFIAGLLHDIGKVVLYLRFPEYFAEVLRLVQEEGRSMYQVEGELMGITHADIGHELARKWELPSTIVTAVAFHHQPSLALQHRRLASLVHLSDILARSLSIGHPGDRAKIKMDPVAEPLAKYVLGVARDKEEVARQVEDMMGGR
jgi:putative nucleotidyltransferase with HDIG domain